MFLTGPQINLGGFLGILEALFLVIALISPGPEVSGLRCRGDFVKDGGQAIGNCGGIVSGFCNNIGDKLLSIDSVIFVIISYGF